MNRGKGPRRGKARGSSEPEQLPLFQTVERKRRRKSQRGGRKPKNGRAGSPHKARPELAARHPVHVVLRVIRDVGNLRRRLTYKAIREATLTTAAREDFRIVQVQGTLLSDQKRMETVAAAGPRKAVLWSIPPCIARSGNAAKFGIRCISVLPAASVPARLATRSCCSCSANRSGSKT